MLVTRAEVTDFITGQGLTLRAAAGSSLIDGRLAAAEAYVTGRMGRSYGVTEAQARIFDGSGTNQMAIDPCQSVSAVKLIDETGATIFAYTSDDYILYPYNTLPKYILRRKPTSVVTIATLASYSGLWPEGIANIQVTGIWGEAAAAPADVKEAIIILATLYILAGDNLPTIKGAIAAALKRYSTGVVEVEFREGGSKEFIAAITGWGDRVKELIESKRFLRPY
jgi:hypothetical protein